MLRYGMRYSDLYDLYGRYTNNWGDTAVSYRFDAVKDGQMVASEIKEPVRSIHLEALPSRTRLVEAETYDAALIRLSMRDQNGNVLPFFQGSVRLQTDGPIRIIGPELTALRGGLGGTIIRTLGMEGRARLTITAEGAEPLCMDFTVEAFNHGKGAM